MAVIYVLSLFISFHHSVVCVEMKNVDRYLRATVNVL